MDDYGRYRYKTMGENSHWLTGGFAINSRIQAIDYSKVPKEIPLKKMLKETHAELYVPEYKLINKIQHKLKRISDIIKN
jgi:predicted aldo/keto reductase-like oxidoreductase